MFCCRNICIGDLERKRKEAALWVGAYETIFYLSSRNIRKHDKFRVFARMEIKLHHHFSYVGNVLQGFTILVQETDIFIEVDNCLAIA